jgi:hypothetical protein
VVPLSSLRRKSSQALPRRGAVCRVCHQLAYLSQSDDQFGAFHRRIGKIKQKLGGEDDCSRKPKRMHEQTFKRLRKKLVDTESQLYQVVSPTMLKSLKRWR